MPRSWRKVRRPLARRVGRGTPDRDRAGRRAATLCRRRNRWFAWPSSWLHLNTEAKPEKCDRESFGGTGWSAVWKRRRFPLGLRSARLARTGRRLPDLFVAQHTAHRLVHASSRKSHRRGGDGGGEKGV